MSFEKFKLERASCLINEDVLKSFDCRDQELNDFLVENAAQYESHGVTATTVCFLYEDKVPAAYFSLSADALKLTGVELTELGLPFEASIPFFPALKITKLAVRHDLQSNGLGSEIIKLIEGIAYAADFSVRLLTVNAVNNSRAISFYERVGFVESSNHSNRKKRPKTILMYKDIYADD